MRIDRIFTLVFLIAITQGFLLVVDPGNGILLNGVPEELIIPLTAVILAALVSITVGIADATVRSHPQIYLLKLPKLRLGRTKLELAPFSWVLPGLLVVSSYLFLRLFNNLTIQVVGTVISSVLLLVVIVAQYYSVGRQGRYYGWSVIGLNIAVYMVGFLFFSAVYVNKWQVFQSVPAVGLVGMLLTYELLRQTKAPASTVTVYSIIIGVVLGEAMLGLHFWLVPVLVGGIVLLLIFYILVGIMQAHLTKNLNAATVREYAIVAVISVGLVIYAFITNIRPRG